MLTQKQEAFVMKYLETDNATEAYKFAYNTKTTRDATIHDNAYKVLIMPEVSQRIRELKQESNQIVLTKLVIDKEFITNGIIKNIIAAELKEENAVALKGYDMLSKMYDLNDDKQNDRLFTDRERVALVENFKARLLNVTPE
ncbi:Terminase small subunit [uncultured Caudovirales phage]|uniref:Terminase small subunit n=1 Tax=uncultured Caudovirales phage TaxID=2100421 RepID=A0A6J5SJD8_9CAUD|nr:Terminase small subunit [uncultured Caudovirales phage]